MNTIRLLIAGIFILAGIIVLITAVIGVFRIKYALNRLHSAAMIDSLGLFLITVGMIAIYGLSFASLKLLLINGLFWFASPVCSHLLAALETATNPDVDKECEILKVEEYDQLKNTSE